VQKGNVPSEDRNETMRFFSRMVNPVFKGSGRGAKASIAEKKGGEERKQHVCGLGVLQSGARGADGGAGFQMNE